jgi:hypothetical protein
MVAGLLDVGALAGDRALEVGEVLVDLATVVSTNHDVEAVLTVAVVLEPTWTCPRASVVAMVCGHRLLP